MRARPRRVSGCRIYSVTTQSRALAIDGHNYDVSAMATRQTHYIYIHMQQACWGAVVSRTRKPRQVYSIWCGAVARGGVADFRYFLIAACLSVRNDVHNVHIRNADWGAIFCGGSFNILIGHLCNKCELIRVIYKQSRRRLKMEHISMM